MKKKTNKTLLFALLFLASTGAGYLIAKAATWGFNGFAWIGNNKQEGQEQGDPVIGMVSMKGSFYEVKIEGEGDQRNLVGSAWLGIGTQDDKFNEFSSQDDLPSLGWIHFNQPFEQAKLNALLNKNCYGAGDCHGVRWNRKSNGAEAEGFLSGWAIAEFGPNGDTTPYPDVLLHFKSPNDPANYSCNEDGNNYYVCVDNNGKLEGYAWSAGAENALVDGNPGLGWIKFSKQFIGLDIEPGSVGTVPVHNQFCATLAETDSPVIGCKNDVEFTGEFKLKAYQTGISLNPTNPDNNFQWTCKDNESPKTGEHVSCIYPNPGTYTPQLKVYDEPSRKWIECANQTNVKVTTETNCSVLVRKASTDQKEEYSKSITIDQNDSVEAMVNRQCLKGGEINWTVTGGTELSQNGDTMKFKPTDTSSIKITAQIIKDGKPINCSAAEARVTETIKWR